MGPVELLRNKRQVLVRDDEALLLLTIGQGVTRPHSLRDKAELPERSFWRAYSAITRAGWIEVVKSRPSGPGVGRGLVSICKLTGEGERIVRVLLGASAPNTAREAIRPVSRGQARSVASIQTTFLELMS
jgi:hypothetical protein